MPIFRVTAGDMTVCNLLAVFAFSPSLGELVSRHADGLSPKPNKDFFNRLARFLDIPSMGEIDQVDSKLLRNLSTRFKIIASQQWCGALLVKFWPILFKPAQGS